ncbi:hypothetical protein [Planococcus lenghuensis]|uniref:Uncharacterized protein n=1 Tax=Planococcus lenghuensis TaxID=2213202 RepID=A0A1Q2KUE8_9BACL|nr:hypothetical protein [Planococcus lenghuensis]AQQ51830.1 hypothetical protein B0X71_00980 [Planococcus lenghuensis]
MRKNALLYGGIVLIIVAFAGLYFGYSLQGTTAKGEGPDLKWLWTTFALQLLAGICFVWQHAVQNRDKKSGSK